MTIMSFIMLGLSVLLGICTIFMYCKWEIKAAWYAVTKKQRYKKDRKKKKYILENTKEMDTICLDTVLMDNPMRILQDITSYESTLENIP